MFFNKRVYTGRDEYTVTFTNTKLVCTDTEKLDPQAKQSYKNFPNNRSTHQANGREKERETHKKGNIKPNSAKDSLLQF